MRRSHLFGLALSRAIPTNSTRLPACGIEALDSAMPLKPALLPTSSYKEMHDD
jgi:hypothetical protein